MVRLLKKLLGIVRIVGFRTIALVTLWAIFAPGIWLYARFFPRKPDRILFWTNEGFRVAPSRLRSYGFCNSIRELGVDASVLSFWDHIVSYQGLPPYRTSLHERTIMMFRAMVMAIQRQAGIIIAQRPWYEFVPLTALKIMYPRSLRIWIDVDDWIFDYALDHHINFRDTLPIHTIISDGCIVPSMHLYQEMTKYFRRVEIIPTYTDPELFQPSADGSGSDGQLVFSWTGTLFVQENLDDVLFLVQALESLKDPRVVLHIVGDGHFLQEARERSEKIATVSTVQFLGWKEPQTMPQYYTGIDVGLYALTTHNDFTRSKSPTKLFEYMACGKPAVCTDFAEAPRFIEHGVTGFVAPDMNGFAKCCSMLLNDPGLRASMGQKARRMIETQYNVNRGATVLRDIILGRPLQV